MENKRPCSHNSLELEQRVFYGYSKLPLGVSATVNGLYGNLSVVYSLPPLYVCCDRLEQTTVTLWKYKAGRIMMCLWTAPAFRRIRPELLKKKKIENLKR